MNGSTWLVANLNENQFSSNPGDDIEIVYGDTLYFSAFTFQYGTECGLIDQPTTPHGW